MKKEERSRVCPGAKRSLFFALRAGVSSAGAGVVVLAALAACCMLTACGGNDPDSPPYGEQPVTTVTPLPYLNGSDFDMETLKNFETSRGSTLEKTKTTDAELGVKKITYRTTHETKAKVEYIMAENATYYRVARVIVPQAAFAHRQDVKDELKAAGFVLRKDKTDFESIDEYDNEKYCVSLYVYVDETDNECIFEYNYNYTRVPESPTLSGMPVDEQWVRKVLYLKGDHPAQLKYNPDVMNWESNSGGRYRNFEDENNDRMHTFDLAGDNPCMRRYFVQIKGPNATNYPNQCDEMQVLYKDLSLGLWKSAYGEYFLNPEMRRLLEQQGFTFIGRGHAPVDRYFFRKGDLIICVTHQNTENTNHQPMLVLSFFKQKE